MTGVVNVSYLHCKDGHSMGVLELANPSALNALTLTMHKTIYQYLQLWQDDESIVCIVIKAAGERAFSAGGDLRSLYYAMDNDPVLCQQEKPPTVPLAYIDSHMAKPFLTEYFSVEYSCNLLVHQYSKPIIAWGNGLIMGGGLGLYMGASHRVGLPDTVLAMPEITIGLYPDVGATWFLNQLPSGIGLFLGLTGAQVNVSDARDLSMIAHILDHNAYDAVIASLIAHTWTYDGIEPRRAAFATSINAILSDYAISNEALLPANQLTPYYAQIQAACSGTDLVTVVSQIEAIDGLGLWLEQAKTNLRHGSPISAHICFKQMREYHEHSLEACMTAELSLSIQCGLLGEFKEGIRAQLIEKDHAPKWIYPSITTVDQRMITQLFTPIVTAKLHSAVTKP